MNRTCKTFQALPDIQGIIIEKLGGIIDTSTGRPLSDRVDVKIDGETMMICGEKNDLSILASVLDEMTDEIAPIKIKLWEK